MDFEFTPDQLALRDAARSVLANACPPALVRGVHESTGTGAAAALWSTLVSLDWPGLAIDESLGGLGLGFVEVGIVTEELGRVVAPVPYLSTVTQYATVLRLAGERAVDRLRAVADGSGVAGTLAVAEDGRWDPRAVRSVATPVGDGRWSLSGTKTHVFDGATADVVAVVARGDAGLGVFLVDRDAAGAALAVESIVGIDPTQPLATLRFDDVIVDAADVLVEPGDPSADDVIARALDEATAAVCLSMVAACRVIFETTLDYAKHREQFGRAIGSFQALKHRLADCFLAVERASALAYFAALTVAEDDPRRSTAVAMAKSAAGDCQRLLTRDGLQLHGGVGYTWEYDLHFWLKRAIAGEVLFGTSMWHRARLAVRLGLVPDESRADVVTVGDRS